MRFLHKTRIDHLLFVFFVVVVISGFMATLMPVKAYALPKPIDDIIQEHKKQKEKEKAEKEKEEKEKKEKEKEKKEKEKPKDERKDKDDDRGKDQNSKREDREKDGEYRYLIPIFRERDYDPEIKLFSLDLLDSRGRKTDFLNPDETSRLEISYRVRGYEGFDDVQISWSVFSDSGREVYSSRQGQPLNLDREVRQTLENAIPSGVLNGSDRYRINLKIEIAGRIVSKTLTGNVNSSPGNIKIYDAYLTTEDSYRRIYPGLPASSLIEGQPFWLVVKYELSGGYDHDVEFEYRIFNWYGNDLYHDYFRENPQSGYETAVRSGQMPYFNSGDVSGITLEVTAKYDQYSTVSRSYYTVRNKDDGYFSPDLTGYLSGRYITYPKFGAIHTASNPVGMVEIRNFRQSDPVYLIVNYTMPLDFSTWVKLFWVVKDARENTVCAGNQWLSTSDGMRIPIEIKLPSGIIPGNYKYVLRIGEQPEFDTYLGGFSIVGDKPAGGADSNQPVIPAGPDSKTEYQLDDYLTFRLPSEWKSKFYYDDKMPPMTFEPASDVSGMVIKFAFDDPATDIGKAVEYYENLERKATNMQSQALLFSSIDGNALIRSYSGEITQLGKYLETVKEKVDIEILYLFVQTSIGYNLYVVRFVGPQGSFGKISQDYAMTVLMDADFPGRKLMQDKAAETKMEIQPLK